MKKTYEDMLIEKKGVAGMDILLSVISMLFVLGIIVMVFILAGSKLSDSLADSTTLTLDNQTLTLLNGTAVNTNVSALRSVTLANVIILNTTDGALVLPGNYTVSGGSITATTSNIFYISPVTVDVSADYTFLEDNSASANIIDTTTAISSVTDWFSTYIVMVSLVVIILLVVIIINSIRQSGISGDSAA